MSRIPWTEAYRPSNFNDVVLDPFNKQILENIIELNHFPNLLFHGPPGTGKTTTIINLINKYQEKINCKNKELIINLNASDERGIDVIRNQINQFVNSRNLFHKGLKFVILDEVDYMTRNAQQALRYLVQSYSENVRFCLICNYVSRIDECLQNEFLKLRFNQLPKFHIYSFLKNISDRENLNLSDETIYTIQELYKSDIRSMINFMQSNQDVINDTIMVINEEIWFDLHNRIILKTSIEELNIFINEISLNYNIDKKNIIKKFLFFIIKFYINICQNNSSENTTYLFNNPNFSFKKFLTFAENSIHLEDCITSHFVNYSLNKLLEM